MLVVVANAKGSVPREAGAWMIVSAERVTGTIGGGHLELKSIEIARSLIAGAAACATVRQFPLGPALGQCCGGAVEIAFVPVTASDRAWIDELREVERVGGTFTLCRTCLLYPSRCV